MSVVLFMLSVSYGYIYHIRYREKAFGARESFRDLVKQEKITVQYCFTSELARSTHNKNSSPALGVTVPCSQTKKRMIQNWVNFDTFVI